MNTINHNNWICNIIDRIFRLQNCEIAKIDYYVTIEFLRKR